MLAWAAPQDRRLRPGFRRRPGHAEALTSAAGALYSRYQAEEAADAILDRESTALVREIHRHSEHVRCGATLASLHRQHLFLSQCGRGLFPRVPRPAWISIGLLFPMLGSRRGAPLKPGSGQAIRPLQISGRGRDRSGGRSLRPRRRCRVKSRSSGRRRNSLIGWPSRLIAKRTAALAMSGRPHGPWRAIKEARGPVVGSGKRNDCTSAPLIRCAFLDAPYRLSGWSTLSLHRENTGSLALAP